MLKDEMATARAGLADDTCASTTAAVFAPLTMETAPDDSDVMDGFDESVMVPEDTETILDPVTLIGPVIDSALDGVIVILDDGVTVLTDSDDSDTAGTPVIATLIFDDGVTVRAEDCETAIEPAELPQKSPTEITCRCEVSGCCTVWTTVADDGVAGAEL